MFPDVLLDRLTAITALVPLLHTGMDKGRVLVRSWYFPDDFTQEFVLALVLVMLFSGNVGPDWQVGIEHQLMLLSFIRHPEQGNVGQNPALLVRSVAAANVRVHAGKPDLLKIGSLLRLPEGRFKGLPLFVERERMPCHPDVTAYLAIVKQVAIPDQPKDRERQPQGADGVPHTDELDGRTLLHGMLFLPRHGVVVVGLMAFGLVELEGGFDQLGIVFTQNAAVVDHPAEAAGGVRASAESEQENLVAGLVVVHQKAIAIHHILFEAIARGTGADLIVVGANAPVIKHHLFHPLTIRRPNGAGELQHIGWKVLAEVLLGAVPGALKADSDAFYGGDLLSFGSLFAGLLSRAHTAGRFSQLFPL